MPWGSCRLYLKGCVSGSSAKWAGGRFKIAIIAENGIPLETMLISRDKLSSSSVQWARSHLLFKRTAAVLHALPAAEDKDRSVETITGAEAYETQAAELTEPVRCWTTIVPWRP